MKILNNSEREITICANGSNYVIPMAKEGNDAEGKKVLIQGSLDIPQEDLETVRDNKVVLHWFKEKLLEVAAQTQPVEEQSEPDEEPTQSKTKVK
jgi:hypothetical protein